MKLGNLNAEVLHLRHGLEAPLTPAETEQQARRDAQFTRSQAEAGAAALRPLDAEVAVSARAGG
ncbi:MAG: hypothetical protein K0Q72_3053 [Armatimonadetes bacterium]|nr:hypothetical protein [Armatimonadota bacterium]